MKKIFLLILCSLFIFPVTDTYCLSQEIVSKPSAASQTRADILEWRYAAINGKLYKRLWNATQNRWETDWIPV